jgi:hypothetical protein
VRDGCRYSETSRQRDAFGTLFKIFGQRRGFGVFEPDLRASEFRKFALEPAFGRIGFWFLVAYLLSGGAALCHGMWRSVWAMYALLGFSVRLRPQARHGLPGHEGRTLAYTDPSPNKAGWAAFLTLHCPAHALAHYRR